MVEGGQMTKKQELINSITMALFEEDLPAEADPERVRLFIPKLLKISKTRRREAFKRAILDGYNCVGAHHVAEDVASLMIEGFKGWNEHDEAGQVLMFIQNMPWYFDPEITGDDDFEAFVGALS